jgi:anti-sigma-K factor RskA
MADDAIKEMICAFALGCMDEKNYKQFKLYVENKGELPQNELGDLQNIVALIPTIINLETPSEELKNELGKRLISIQKDIKNKVVENRRETRIAADKFMQRNSSTKVFDVNEKRMGAAQKTDRLPSKTKTPKSNNATRLNTISQPVKRGSKINNVLQWIFSLILLITIILISYLFMGEISLIEEANTELKNKVVKLRTDISLTENFLNQSMEFVEFFNNSDIDIIQLKGIESDSRKSGRLFISFGSGEGLLQLQNMPRIDADMTYQLWLISKSGTFSIGTFEIKPDKKYMPISEIPFVIKDDIEMFRITKEKKDSALTPTGETILFGALRKEVPTKKRRR